MANRQNPSVFHNWCSIVTALFAIGSLSVTLLLFPFLILYLFLDMPNDNVDMTPVSVRVRLMVFVLDIFISSFILSAVLGPEFGSQLTPFLKEHTNSSIFAITVVNILGSLLLSACLELASDITRTRANWLPLGMWMVMLVVCTLSGYMPSVKSVAYILGASSSFSFLLYFTALLDVNNTTTGKLTVKAAHAATKGFAAVFNWYRVRRLSYKATQSLRAKLVESCNSLQAALDKKASKIADFDRNAWNELLSSLSSLCEVLDDIDAGPKARKILERLIPAIAHLKTLLLDRMEINADDLAIVLEASTNCRDSAIDHQMPQIRQKGKALRSRLAKLTPAR